MLEKVDGRPIDDYCANLPLARRLEVFLTLCRAVGAAHRQLILHCDLKPSNVLVRADGLVKLLEFGLARRAGRRQDPGSRALGLGLLGNVAYARDQLDRAEDLLTEAEALSLVHHGWPSALHELQLNDLIRLKGHLYRHAESDRSVRGAELATLTRRLLEERSVRRPVGDDAFTYNRSFELATLLAEEGQLGTGLADFESALARARTLRDTERRRERASP